jgi:hypothetical protein
MKKYIFTEGQLKKIIDSQISEQMSPSKVSTASGTIRKAPSVQDDVDTIIKLRKQKVKLVILGFRSSMKNSDLYNKNYKKPTNIGSIAGIPIDNNSKGKHFDNDTTITLIDGGTLVFGIVGVEKRYAEANGGLTITNEGGKLKLDFAWD